MCLIALPKEQSVLPEEQIEDATKEGNKLLKLSTDIHSLSAVASG
jgi:hypothetical protein